MANENDQQPHNHSTTSSSSSHHHNTSDLQTDSEKIDTTTMKTKTDTDNDGGLHKVEACNKSLYYNNNEGEANTDHDLEEMPPTASKGKLNDLVADLCINGHRQPQTQQQIGGGGGGGGYGDYTNSRPGGMGGEAFSHQSSVDISGSDNSYSVTSSHNVVQPPTQNSSSFSFKHFLSSSSAPTAPSTTVTSLDPPATNNSTSTSSVSSSAISSRSLQTSTGARPKVPQSNSVSSTLISSLIGGGGNGGGMSASSSLGEGHSLNATKMKRSPRFSSFDSQASLAEYAGATTSADLPPAEPSSGTTRTSEYHLYAGDDRQRFTDWNIPSNFSNIAPNTLNFDRGQYVPRSYSNYEMPTPLLCANAASNRDVRPTRLTLNSNSNTKMAAKLKLDLPLNQNSSSGTNSSNSGGGIATSRKRAISTRSSEFQAANPLPGAAAALPDFVQDHWMDSWYANDMHVNSPPRSPISGFAADMPGSSGDKATGGQVNKRQSDKNPLPAPAEMSGFQMGLPEKPSSSVGSKMLPDFLSDGPIIHSSQRLADIATGLPSNSVGSPDESTQLSSLRIENAFLQRELNESMLALTQQTLRANNLERKLLEQQRQYKSETDETSDTNNTNSTDMLLKLKQQVQELTTEVEILRREKELMREEGAVGGCGAINCDRSPYSDAGAGSTVVTSSNSTSTAGCAMPSSADMGKHNIGGGCAGISSSTCAGASGAAGIEREGIGMVRGLGNRPSRAQQISRDLRRAASNAEQNLRHLLAGVDNLRQMASNIEKTETILDYDVSPDLFSDFLDDCDEFGKYPGGPAL